MAVTLEFLSEPEPSEIGKGRLKEKGEKESAIVETLWLCSTLYADILCCFEVVLPLSAISKTGLAKPRSVSNFLSSF